MNIVKEFRKEFEEKFGKRIDLVETMAQLHGTPPWTGETIPEWLQQKLDQAIKEEREDIARHLEGLIEAGKEKGWITLNEVEMVLKSLQEKEKKV